MVRGFDRDTRRVNVEQGIMTAFEGVTGKASRPGHRSPAGHITFGSEDDLKKFIESEKDAPKKKYSQRELSVGRYESFDDYLWNKSSVR